MNDTRKKKPGKRAETVEARLERIATLAEMSDEDEVHPQLFEDIEWVVDKGVEDRVYDMMEDEDLSDDACDAIEFALEEAGYRLQLFEESPEAGQEVAPVVLIPFAIAFVAPVSPDHVRKFPLELKKTAKRLAESKQFRKLIELGESDRIIFDSRLYHVDHDEWRQESSVRRYLKGMAKSLAGSVRRFPPLAADYKAPPQIEEGGADAEQIYLIQRALCGAVLVQDGEEAGELEDRLFGISEDDDEATLDWVGELIGEELAALGVGFGVSPLVFPELVELWAVPSIAFRFQRMIEVRREIEMANERFIEMAPTGRTIEPVLYVSSHGEEIPEEIRLAAYPSDAEDEEPYFTYVWEIDHDLETPEEVSDTIIEIASELNARITIVDGLLEDERCEDCNGKLFHGPGGQSHSVD